MTFGPAMKHDMHRQTTQVHDYGRGRMTSEPVFVRKPGATVEDEGGIRDRMETAALADVRNRSRRFVSHPQTWLRSMSSAGCGRK